MDFLKLSIDVDSREPVKEIGQWAKARRVLVETPAVPIKHTFMGIDPGVNFGVALLTRRGLRLIWGELQGYDEVEQMFAASQVALYFRDAFGPILTVVEGPAPKFPYRQATLGHMRAGFIIGAMPNVLMIPPATIRVLAFGHGNETGLNIWPRVNENAIAALGCVLAAVKKAPN